MMQVFERLKGRFLPSSQESGNQAKACSSLLLHGNGTNCKPAELKDFVFNDKVFSGQRVKMRWGRPYYGYTYGYIGNVLVSRWCLLEGEPFLSSTVFLMAALRIPRKVQRVLRLGMEPILTPNPGQWR